MNINPNTAATPLPFFLTSSTDHISGLTGLGSGAVATISKNAGAFAAPSGAISEIGNGWYQVAGNATDTNTLGPLLLHATGTGADPSDTHIADVVLPPGAQSGTVATSLAPTATQFDSTQLNNANAMFYVGLSVYPYGASALSGQLAGVVTAYSKVGGNGRFTISGSPSSQAMAQGDSFYLA